MKYLYLIYLALLANSVFSYNFNDSRIFQECSDNKLFLHNDKKLKIHCNDMYHLYLGKGSKVATPKKVKIAGYNIYKLGSRETKFKSLNINAQLITQWDVVAVTELLPLQGLSAFSNRSLNVLIDDFLETTEFDGDSLTKELRKKFKDKYKVPGYLMLLQKLRKIDPKSGWSLILSPYSQSRNFELSGFYFKSSVVKLKALPYCDLTREYLSSEGAIESYKDFVDDIVYKTVVSKLPYKNRHYACFPKIENKYAKFMGRLPFMARFKVKDYDFTLLTIHARFRENPDPEAKLVEIKHILDTFHSKGKAIPLIRARLMGKLIKEKLGKISHLTDEERENESVKKVLKSKKITAKLLQERKDHQIADTKLVRFYEVYQSARVMKKIHKKGNKNVMMVGDFNLKLNPAEREKINYWKKVRRAYPGSKIYNSSPTSVSVKDKLANDYDHFILKPTLNQNCMKEESQEQEEEMNITTFDFMKEESYKDLKFSSWNELIEPYLNPSSRQRERLISDFEEKIEQKNYFKGMTLNTINYAPFSSFNGNFRDCRKKGKLTSLNAVSAFVKGYDCSLFYSQKNPDKKWKVYKSLISDHLPLVLSCDL